MCRIQRAERQRPHSCDWFEKGGLHDLYGSFITESVVLRGPLSYTSSGTLEPGACRCPELGLVASITVLRLSSKHKRSRQIRTGSEPQLTSTVPDNSLNSVQLELKRRRRLGASRPGPDSEATCGARCTFTDSRAVTTEVLVPAAPCTSSPTSHGSARRGSPA
eukprot:932801-Rhodomonas_salina.1